MRAADIEKLVSVSRPAVAPDGTFAIAAVSRPDLRANLDVGQLWRFDLEGRAPARRLTRGVADRAPALSPDGALIAFLRGDTSNKPQIHVIAAGGSEPVQVTDQPLGVSEFAWSPDSERLAYVARVPEPGRYGSIEGLDAAAEAPRHITGIRWHANGVGYIGDRPAHVFVVPAPDVNAEPLYAAAPALPGEWGTDGESQGVPAASTQLTHGTASYGGVVFTADGTEVLAGVDEIEARTRDLRARLVAISVDGGAEREVLSVDAGLSVNEIAVLPDGTIALLASDAGAGGIDFIAPGVALFLLRDGVPVQITDPELYDLGEVGSHIGAIGDDVLVQDRTRGRLRLLRVTRAGGVTEVLGGDVEVLGHGVAGDRIVATIANAETFGEIVVIEGGAGSEPRTLTNFGAALRETGLVAPREITVTARDGAEVHGWIATPAGEGPHPVILNIHGGPFAQYSVHVFDETQVLVDAGYAVVYCNPRGSAGYGREHGRSIRGAMGTVDYTDVLDFLEGALASDVTLDAGRLGIMGGSYGGFMTAWVIAHDHRFAGAIVERGFLDPVSFQGTSDIGSFFGDEYAGTSPEAMAAQSPMAHAGSVTTPTLVMHSELDFRCPLEQATRYYTALKRADVDAEMLIFPGENHELSRGGQPRHRVQRFAAVLDWWARRLPVH
ncbi:MAG TPA: S9 family peptidase [Microbacteriaceae bacterium]|jgi:dipeptidyl aminopeptidase/acylaminoacyl peptidase|nr:S9 family peptidase [Microbacteriaceae bacterium]HQZ47865.1 S9 family peptidase [Microbacteriaceae bacterium]HRA08920.1 S9 family peptidase [Microbacteriaceae bacterium]